MLIPFSPFLIFWGFFFFPLQIIMLVLAWKLEAESMGFFTKEEWLKGMTSLQ